MEVVASLPYYTAERTDAQRGEKVFEKSIQALRLLNGLGYGAGRERPQAEPCVQSDRRVPAAGAARHRGGFPPRAPCAATASISTISIRSRTCRSAGFWNSCSRSGNYDGYMQRLIQAYNREAAAGVMCRYTLSVGWDGTLYDCDFNQMIDLTVDHGAPAHIRDFDFAALAEPPDRHRPALLRLYGRRRFQLRGSDGVDRADNRIQSLRRETRVSAARLKIPCFSSENSGNFLHN